MIGEYLNKQFANDNPVPLNKPMRWLLKNGGRNILDYGCGKGHLLKTIYDNYYIDSLTGIDPHLDRQSNLITPIQCRTNQKLYLYTGALEKLKILESNHYDVIICMNVLEHIPYPEHLLVIQEFKRILKPRGYIYIETPNARSIFSPYGFYDEPTHIRPFSETSLKMLGMMFDLKVVKADKSFFWKSVIATPYLLLKYLLLWNKQ